ncbi:MAG: glycosyltransferase family 9 protein [archaeon]
MEMDMIKVLDKYGGIPICVGLYSFDKITSPFRVPSSKKVRNILMLKFWGFGNIIMATPTIRAVKKKYPFAKITFVTLSKNKNILEKNLDVDEIIYFQVENLSQVVKDVLNLMLTFRKNKYDLILDLEQFARTSSILAYLSGTKKRVGFTTQGQGRGFMYPIKVVYNNDQHMVKTFTDIAKAVGANPDNYDLTKLDYSKEDEEYVNDYWDMVGVTKNDFIIGMHVSSGENVTARRWPKQNFAKLADEFIKTYKAKIVLTGAPSEKDAVQEVIDMIKNKGNVVNSTGKVNLSQLAALIDRCDVFVSNDTGPMHMAAAVSTPTLSFFGPNTPYLYGPWQKNKIDFFLDLDCSPCITNFNNKSTNCKDAKCLKQITVKDVMEKSKTFLTKIQNERRV